MKIKGIAGMNVSELEMELSRGGRFVFYQFCVSMVLVTFKRSSDIYFIRPGESRMWPGWPFTLLSLVAGWWGFPWGPIYTIAAIANNLSGGKDVTDEVAGQIKGLNYIPQASPAPARHSSKAWVAILIGAIVATVCTGVCLVSFYHMRHQRIHLVNGFPSSAVVEIPGAGKTEVPKHQRKEIFLPEGKHQAILSLQGTAPEKVSFEIQNTFWGRFDDRTVHVLDIEKGAVLFWETTLYSEHPESSSRDEHRLYVGEPFFSVPGVDYPFEEFPETISISEKAEIRKSRLGLLNAPPSKTMDFLEDEKVPPEKVFSFAEAHLKVEPSDTDLVYRYCQACVLHGGMERGIAFFKARLSVRPILMDWHKSYQELMGRQGKEPEVIAQYEDLLRQSPSDSDLIYLRGRLEDENSKSISFMVRATEANHGNRYPMYALGYSYLSLGDYPKARAALARSCAIDPADRASKDLFYEARFGLREYGAIAEEATASLKKDPADIAAFDHLIQALVAQGKADDARDEAKRFIRAAAKAEPGGQKYIENIVTARLSYYLGDLGDCLKCAKGLGDDKASLFYQFHCHLASLRMTEAEEISKKLGDADPGFTPLLLSAGWRAAGDGGKASSEVEAAVSSFRGPYQKNRQIAELLTGKDPSALQRVKDLDLTPEEKTILCLALAGLYPGQRDALLALGEHLDIGLMPPHLFLVKAGAALRKRAA